VRSSLVREQVLDAVHLGGTAKRGRRLVDTERHACLIGRFAGTNQCRKTVDAGEVAARLVELALATPAGLVPDIGGPRVYATSDLLRAYLRARGRRRALMPIPVPGRAARALRDGANLTPDRAVGRRTWEEFLAERVGSPNDR
jgi:hypothetical protein